MVLIAADRRQAGTRVKTDNAVLNAGLGSESCCEINHRQQSVPGRNAEFTDRNPFATQVSRQVGCPEHAISIVGTRQKSEFLLLACCASSSSSLSEQVVLRQADAAPKSLEQAFDHEIPGTTLEV